LQKKTFVPQVIQHLRFCLYLHVQPPKLINVINNKHKAYHVETTSAYSIVNHGKHTVIFKKGLCTSATFSLPLVDMVVICGGRYFHPLTNIHKLKHSEGLNI